MYVLAKHARPSKGRRPSRCRDETSGLPLVLRDSATGTPTSTADVPGLGVEASYKFVGIAGPRCLRRPSSETGVYVP